jgi:hypothetical protein
MKRIKKVESTIRLCNKEWQQNSPITTNGGPLRSARNHKEYKWMYEHGQGYFALIQKFTSDLREKRQHLYSEFDKILRDASFHHHQYYDEEWIKNTMARLLEEEDDSSDEESETNSDSEDDNNESDDQMHEVIKSVETENSVHDSLQVKQQREQHYRTI